MAGQQSKDKIGDNAIIDATSKRVTRTSLDHRILQNLLLGLTTKLIRLRAIANTH